MAVEKLRCPIKMLIFQSYVSLQEGTQKVYEKVVVIYSRKRHSLDQPVMASTTDADPQLRMCSTDHRQQVVADPLQRILWLGASGEHWRLHAYILMGPHCTVLVFPMPLGCVEKF